MKYGLTIAISLFIVFGSLKADDYEEYLKLGKAEFKKDFFEQNYAVAVENLEKAVKLRPNSAEAHYFLGYAYSRINAKDGRDMINNKLPLTLKSSEEFETVIKLEPKYKGEKVVIDQYSKLTSDWSSLAMTYLYRNKADSAKWAFKEGKKRGGFGDFLLAYHRAVLDKCSKNAILMSSGDNSTFPLWYLQTVENYRPDVSIIDIGLLNAEWYAGFLVKKYNLDFGMTKEELDTIDYLSWYDTPVEIGDFKWTVKANYEGLYLLRANRLFLNLIYTNEFKRDVFFTASYDEGDMLNLEDYLTRMLVVYKLDVKKNSALTSEQIKSAAAKIFPIVSKANVNSTDELNFVDLLRFNFLSSMVDMISAGDTENAKAVLSIMDKHAGEFVYPYQDNAWKESADQVRDWFKN